MDWAVAGERSRTTVVFGKTRGHTFHYIVERTFERRDGFVLPIEELRGLPHVRGPSLFFDPMRTRYAWELNPDLDPAIFDPNRYLAEPLAPRTSPFPWYFIPLAIGGGMVAFLIARSLVRLVRRLGRSKELEPAAAEG